MNPAPHPLWSQSMWEDTREWTLRRLGQAIPTQAADGEKFTFKSFMLSDLFFHSTRKCLDDWCGDNRLHSGQWELLNIPEGGVTVLCAMLKTQALPQRETGGSVISIATVTQLAYNKQRREFRVRGVLGVGKAE